MSNAQPGWYDDGSGRRRWWDGGQWTEHFEQPPAPVAAYAAPQPPQQQWAQQPQAQWQQPPAQQWQQDPRMANGMPVSYVRQQQGHSLTLWIILSLFFVIPVIWLIYFSASPNHYWHA